MNDRVLVLGATGQVGSAIVAALDHSAVGWSSRDLDLANASMIRSHIEAAQPTVVINCAAYNLVDQAETEPDVAFAVNATGVGELATATAAVGARFVTYSTDYVFDGEQAEPYLERDLPNPMSVYGSSKLEGERLAADANPGSLIIRTSWVMSPAPRGFAATVLRLAQEGGGRVVADQVGTPTMAIDLAAATLSAMRDGVSGLLHCANGPEISRFGLARQIVDIAGLDPELIQPCSTEEFGAAARRPRYSALGSERERGPLGDYRPGLEEAVAELMTAS